MKDYYTKKELLKKGFTEKLIKEHLPVPQKRVIATGVRRYTQLRWNRTDVDTIMESKEFQEKMAATESAKESANKAVSTRRKNDADNLKAFLDTISIICTTPIDEIKRIIDEECVVEGDFTSLDVFDYNQFEKYRDAELYFFAFEDLCEKNICNFSGEYSQMSIVNFVYNHRIKYDSNLFKPAHTTNYIAWFTEKEMCIYNLIAKHYPELKDVCAELLSFKTKLLTEDYENRNNPYYSPVIIKR